MTRERSINLVGWEARAMHALPAGGTMLLSRPITPLKPRYDCIGYCEHCGLHRNAHDGYDCADGFAIAEDKCPWQVGDVLLCREAWHPLPPVCGIGYEEAIYRASLNPGEKVMGLRWRSAATMPRWAVRLRPTVLGVRAGRINALSHADLARHALPFGEFHTLWDKRWGKRYPWARNPRAWTMEVKRGND